MFLCMPCTTSKSVLPSNSFLSLSLFQVDAQNGKRKNCRWGYGSGEFNNFHYSRTLVCPCVLRVKYASSAGLLVGLVRRACQHVPLLVGTVCHCRGPSFCLLHWLLLCQIQGSSLYFFSWRGWTSLVSIAGLKPRFLSSNI